MFDVMCAYLLWRGRSQVLNLRELIERDETINLGSESSRHEAVSRIREFASKQQLSAEAKDRLLACVADELEINYQQMIDRRAMHLLNPDEVKSLANDGIDFQLHTHRHRTPMDRELFLREIEDNRNGILAMTGRRADHFCYPSGAYEPSFLPWLREAGVVSATTCDFGLASGASDPLLLSRLVDVSSLSEIEFESCLSGVSAALPRRRERQETAA